MQSAYDLWNASREVDVSKLQSLKPAEPRETAWRPLARTVE
jgi:hypothetical protein